MYQLNLITDLACNQNIIVTTYTEIRFLPLIIVIVTRVHSSP